MDAILPKLVWIALMSVVNTNLNLKVRIMMYKALYHIFLAIETSCLKCSVTSKLHIYLKQQYTIQ